MSWSHRTLRADHRGLEGASYSAEGGRGGEDLWRQNRRYFAVALTLDGGGEGVSRRKKRTQSSRRRSCRKIRSRSQGRQRFVGNVRQNSQKNQFPKKQNKNRQTRCSFSKEFFGDNILPAYLGNRIGRRWLLRASPGFLRFLFSGLHYAFPLRHLPGGSSEEGVHSFLLLEMKTAGVRWPLQPHHALWQQPCKKEVKDL